MALALGATRALEVTPAAAILPTEVILVCAAVCIVPVNSAPVLPIVAALIVVPVNVPDAPIVVKEAELAVALPIGVFCIPPCAVNPP